MSYTLVAIPSKDDHVWKVSSEKIPHLTVLFLGDNLENVPGVIDFIGHVADVSLPRFGLSVDRRDTLGDKDADVLFFEKNAWEYKWIYDARANLLKNRDILTAYNTTEQYPEWIPHLTLGYPETPAKEDPRDYPISWVDFDRLALWTDDYDGPEFPLKRVNSFVDEVSMSMSSNEALKHFGVLGMHWGKRKARPTSEDRIRKNVRSGMNRADAERAEKSRKNRKRLLIIGGAYAASMLLTHGPGLAQGVANNYVAKKTAAAGAKAAADMFSNTNGLGAHKIIDLGFDAASGVFK